MKGLFTITTAVLAAIGVQAAPSNPEFGMQVNTNLPETGNSLHPLAVLAFKECIQKKKKEDLVTDFSKEEEGTYVFSNIPGECCAKLKGQVAKEGWLKNAGEIEFDGGEPCTKITLTKVPKKLNGKVHRLAGKAKGP